MLDENEGILNSRGLKIAHLNVASILGAHKFEMLRKQVEGSHLNVFCASETWLNASIPNGLIDIRGYNVARWDRSWKNCTTDNLMKKGGGLICYTSQNVIMNEFRYARLNQSNRDLEMQWISLEMKNLRRIVVINIYRPPQGDYKKACKLAHEAVRDAGLKDNVDIFLMGDFNINFGDKRSPATKEWISTMDLWGLKQLINGYTRLGVGNETLKGSCIDNIFSNSELVEEACTMDWNFSDHLMVVARRKKSVLSQEKVEFKGRSYIDYVREDLLQELINYDWGEFYTTVDPSLGWGIILDRIRSYLNRTCPLKSFRVKEIRELWVTNELLEEIKDKDRALRVAKRSGKNEDWARAKAERNRVGRLVEQTKADFLKDQQAQLEGDPKKFWRLVKSLVPSKNKGNSKISLNSKAVNGEEIGVEDAQVANFINDFFCEIGPNLARKYNKPWKFYGEVTEETCPQMSTDFEQVLNLCKEIKATKSSGYKDISTKVFKDAFVVLIPQLVYVFNQSFQSGVFPDSWKQATIIPLYKGGNKTDVSNYRPVSLLPLPGKILEKIAHSKLSLFLENNDVITNKQGGFRKGFSTASSIADLTDDLYSNINEGLTSLATFVDLRKAFDTVNHEILLQKIKCYGIRNKNLDWCTNYLNNRSQKTLANGVLSSAKGVTCGVPQGSVLGPLFFILYVNDVQKAVRGSRLQLYADDTVIYAEGGNSQEAIDKLQPSLVQFTDWCKANKLSLNATKTKLMVFGTRPKVKKAKEAVVRIENLPLQMVPTYKYLGITLDSTLSFNYHVRSLAATVAYKANLLAKIRKYLNEDVAMKIFKSMIIPYFDYGDVIYNSAGQEGLDKLQRLQNRCLKICKGFNKRFDTKDLHVITKIPMLASRRSAHINNFMYNRLRIQSLVDKRDIRTRAHDAPVFKVEIPNVETYKRSVRYAGALQWNNLSKETRNITTFKAFKENQKAVMKNG